MVAKSNPALNASLRTVTGRKTRELRRQGKVPSTIYGKGLDPITIEFNLVDFKPIFAHVGESGLVDIIIDSQKHPVLFKNPQYHALTDILLHIDCYQVNLKEKITATVPIEIIGESPAVKLGNVLVEVSDSIEIEALPADLPEKITVDISNLTEVDQMITVEALDIDKSILEIKTPADQVIVKVEAPKVEEEPVVEEVAPEDVPATAQKAADESASADGQSEDSKKEEAKKE